MSLEGVRVVAVRRGGKPPWRLFTRRSQPPRVGDLLRICKPNYAPLLAERRVEGTPSGCRDVMVDRVTEAATFAYLW